MKYSKSKVKIAAKTIQGLAVITIEDDGSGIPKEDEEKIFNIFGNIDESSLLHMGYKKGSIGLYTVKLLAEQCGKNITVGRSLLFGGALFTITDMKGK